MQNANTDKWPPQKAGAGGAFLSTHFLETAAGGLSLTACAWLHTHLVDIVSYISIPIYMHAKPMYSYIQGVYI